MRPDSDRTRRGYSQALRVLHIYNALANASRGLTIQELEQRTGVTRRTLNRDLAVLQENYLVDAHDVGGRSRKRWALLPAGPAGAVSFTRGELAALQLGTSMLDFLAATDLGAAMQSALAKVTSRLGSAGGGLDRKLYALPDAPPVEVSSERFDDILNETLSALFREQRLELCYPIGRPPQPQQVLVDPLTLVYFRGRLYLAALSPAHGGVHPFALHRVQAARWRRGEAAEIPTGYHPSTYFASSFGIFGGEGAERVRVRVAAGAARALRERRWHHSQRVADLADGGCEVCWELPLTPDFETWLLSFGPELVVQEPAALRLRVAERLRRAAEAYNVDEEGGGGC
jgi:proteasome accessory factor B